MSASSIRRNSLTIRWKTRHSAPSWRCCGRGCCRRRCHRYRAVRKVRRAIRSTGHPGDTRVVLLLIFVTVVLVRGIKVRVHRKEGFVADRAANLLPVKVFPARHRERRRGKGDRVVPRGIPQASRRRANATTNITPTSASVTLLITSYTTATGDNRPNVPEPYSGSSTSRPS